MKTLALILAFWVATIAPPRPPPSPPPPREPAPKQQSGGPQFIITDATEILLDGKPVEFADVPAGAIIVEMAVAADGRTLLRISFRSPP